MSDLDAAAAAECDELRELAGHVRTILRRDAPLMLLHGGWGRDFFFQEHGSWHFLTRGEQVSVYKLEHRAIDRRLMFSMDGDDGDRIISRGYRYDYETCFKLLLWMRRHLILDALADV